MVSVRVRAIMELAEVFGCREQTVALPDGARVTDLLVRLEARYGERFAGICYEPETRQISSQVQILVNGRNIAFLEGPDPRLWDGDDVFFLVPAMGG